MLQVAPIGGAVWSGFPIIGQWIMDIPTTGGYRGIMITAAFGLIAALAWNGTIQTIFKEVYGEASTITAMLVYAVIVTIIAVIVTLWVAKIAEKTK